jgi:hypothetical protein
MPPLSPLSLHAGPRALALIRERGLAPELFSTWLGASGGPKWIALYGLDRVLARRFLAGGKTRVALVGSSIGSWRHACLAQRDPQAALDRFLEAYIAQRYRKAPTPAEVTEQAAVILEHLLGSTGADDIAHHAELHTHVIAAQCRGLLGSEQRALLMLGLGVAAASNALHRGALGLFFRRALFHTGAAASVALHSVGSIHVPLAAHNLRPALLASGAIPLVLAGVRDIAGAPVATYRDGGMVDYHFDFAMRRPEGLCLFPHFGSPAQLIPGWFDKGLPFRRIRGAVLDDVVVLSPSPSLVRALPGGKIPDRTDFAELDDDSRMRAWRQAVDASRRMGDALERVLDDPDPARHFEPL